MVCSVDAERATRRAASTHSAPGVVRSSSREPAARRASSRPRRTAEVEGVAAAGGDSRAAPRRRRGDAHGRRAGGPGWPARRAVRGPVRRAVRQRADEQGDGREAVLGEVDCRLEERRQRQRAEALVQRAPSVDAPGHRDACGCRGGTASRCGPRARSAAASAPAPARPLELSAWTRSAVREPARTGRRPCRTGAGR